eukprot:COSAG04_NODE_6526_length_1309_cov_30.300826_3_plen_175_part_00
MLALGIDSAAEAFISYLLVLIYLALSSWEHAWEVDSSEASSLTALRPAPLCVRPLSGAVPVRTATPTPCLPACIARSRPPGGWLRRGSDRRRLGGSPSLRSDQRRAAGRLTPRDPESGRSSDRARCPTGWAWAWCAATPARSTPSTAAAAPCPHPSSAALELSPLLLWPGTTTC